METIKRIRQINREIEEINDFLDALGLLPSNGYYDTKLAKLYEERVKLRNLREVQGVGP